MKQPLSAVMQSMWTAPFLFLASSSFVLAQDVVITEFMASNSTVLQDEDSDYEDWIEIYNQSGSPVDLSGWHLTDDAALLTKWTFPDVVLGTGEIMVVFASNKDRAEAGQELHTNFKLTSSGEYLGLVRADGVTVEYDFGALYPQQVTDVSYGLQQTTTVTTMVDTGAALKYHVPTSAVDDVDEGVNPNSWIGTGFDDSSWPNGTSGIGYATATTDAYDPFIATDVESVLFNQSGRTSVYIRIPFSVINPAEISNLILKMNYDDGFVAYLNGDPEPVAEALSPSPDQLSYASTATGIHDDSDAIVEELFSFPSSFLNVGANVLCIHGLNRSATSSDILFLPKLEGTVIGGTSTAAYFTTATPGSANVAGSESPGPIIKNVTKDLMPLVTSSGDLAIEAEVAPTLNVVSSVSLISRVMYGTETTVTMFDNGAGGDLVAGDGIYTATIPISGMAPGEMLRWKVTATDSSNVVSRQPLFPDPVDSAEYYGTIAADPSVNSSNLPIFHWFTSDPSGANATSPGSRGSVYYLGRFYDNIQADRHGQSTGGFSKKSYDFDFNKGDRFLPYEGGVLAKDINMITNWADKSKTRNTIGYEIMRNSGHPAHYSFPVRIQQNGAFFSTADLIEDGDDKYLDRAGLDENGALYKMYNRLDSSSSGVNKKTRKEENNNDLTALVNGLGQSGDAKLRYGYDNMSIPGTINYLAALDMTNNRDHGHKNYYVFRDTEGTGEWRPLIWDIDLCLGRNWVSGPAYFDDTFTNNALRAGPSNRMKTLIFDDPVLNQMYLRRMRTLMDQMLGHPSMPVDYLQTRVNELVALIDPTNDNPATGSDDADLDYQKWGSWGNQNAMRPASNRILTEFIPTRRAQLYGLGEIPGSQPVAAQINIGTIDFNPTSSGAAADQRGEYFELTNPNSYAVDCSDWVISGGISMILPPGAVIPAGGALHVGRDAVGFRSRAVSPKADEKRYLVSGYGGQLSARGETITLHDNLANRISTVTYAGAETPAQKSLRIAELHYAPADPTPAELSSIPTLGASDFEFIELTNTGVTNLDLSGTSFTEGVAMTFAPGTILRPGQRVIVVSNQAAFELRYGAAHPVVGQFSGNLSKGGEQIQIVDSVGENVLEFSYNDTWYPQTDGAGYSLVMLDPSGTAVTDFDVAANWGVSLAVGGDPGAGSSGVAMTFEFWKNQKFSALQVADDLVVGPAVDLDGDGLNTVFEYAFGFDPEIAEVTPGYSAVVVDDGGSDYQTMTFRRRTSSLDLVYTVEVSDDLVGWDPVTTVVGTPVVNGDGTETVTIRDVLKIIDRQQRFVRLLVTITP
ncbi:MAG: lamin tail domain-containing protein [Akkermansiaceae bacterium]|jgi:hypothetical protein